MTIYDQITCRIIKYQEEIIGQLAWNVAAKVRGLVIMNRKNPEVAITVEPKTAINELVAIFEEIWGKLGKMECQEATADLTKNMNPEEIPDSLK